MDGTVDGTGVARTAAVRKAVVRRRNQTKTQKVLHQRLLHQQLPSNNRFVWLKFGGGNDNVQL